MTIKMTIFTHRPHVSLPRFMFCLWLHNRSRMASPGQNRSSIIVMCVREKRNLDVDCIQDYFHGGINNLSTQPYSSADNTIILKKMLGILTIISLTLRLWLICIVSEEYLSVACVGGSHFNVLHNSLINCAVQSKTRLIRLWWPLDEIYLEWNSSGFRSLRCTKFPRSAWW